MGEQPRGATVCKTVGSQTTPAVLRLFEEVLIDLFEHEGLFDDNAAVMLDHERGQLGAIDEHQAGVHAVGIVHGLGAETGGGDEDPAAGLGTVQRSDESLDVRAADVLVGVALGLHVHDVQAQGIEADQPVQPRIAGTAEVLGVPLTGARAGSLSTRTTHPHFIASFSECVRQLGITNPIVNPFRTMTKGEILAACHDQKTLRGLASQTLSCAHPETARWAQEKQTNCGYCFPCLIRRASMHHVGLDRARDYTYDALADDLELAVAKGNDRRALIRSLNQPSKPTDVLRNGPVPAEDVAAFAGVYERGRREILTWMTSAGPSPAIRRQLPAL